MNKTANNILSFLTVAIIGVATIYLLSQIAPTSQPVSKSDLVQEVQTQVSQQQNQPSLFPDYDLNETVAK